MRRSTHSPQSAAHAYEEEQDDFDFEDVGQDAPSTPTPDQIKEVDNEENVGEGQDGVLVVSQDYRKKDSSSTRSSSSTPSRFATTPIPDNIENEKHETEKKNRSRKLIIIIIIVTILLN